MPSLKRLSSVCHSIAHHAASGLSFIHPHLRRACRDIGIDVLTIDLKSEEPCPERFRTIEPVRLSLGALRKKAEEILASEGFTLHELDGLELLVDFRPSFPDDYCSNCYAMVRHKSGKVFRDGVNYLGDVVPPTAEEGS